MEHLKITVEIDQNARSGIRLIPRDSKLPRAVQSLKDVKREEVIEEMPICFGYIPKALMEAVKRGNVCQADFIEANDVEPPASLAGVNLNSAINPPGCGEVADNAFDLVAIKWAVKLYTHKIEATTCSGPTQICQPL